MVKGLYSSGGRMAQPEDTIVHLPRGDSGLGHPPRAPLGRPKRPPKHDGFPSRGPLEEGGSESPETRPRRYTNRELSWLDFASRVLALAEDRATPVLERAKFLAIVSNSLDEFFQVRVAGLVEQVGAGVGATTPPDGMTAHDQLRAIRSRVLDLVQRQSVIFVNEVAPTLRDAGITIAPIDELDADARIWLRRFFETRIFPVLTPLAVDPAHPFPYISNLSLNLAVTLRDPSDQLGRFARVKVPPLLDRFVALPDGARFVPLEQVIADNLSALFPGMDVTGVHPFRVTRNADLDLEEDEADDLLAAIEIELRRRHRFADVVRLEVGAAMPGTVRDLLMRELEIGESSLYVYPVMLDLGGLWSLHSLDRPRLKDDAWPGVPLARAVTTRTAEAADFWELLSEQDILVHHPYDSFAASVEAFIEQASTDPAVLAIKQTLYRTTGPESGIMRALIRAAERGKQVVALVELKARFDEEANIVWAKTLEEAGVHVVYGMVGLKTHAKVALIVRRENDTIRNYVHLGTGNYNPKTATTYEDIGLLSADPELGADVAELFNHLTGHSHQSQWRRLLVAPGGLRAAILHKIDEESHWPDGRIVLKMNSLVDPEIIDALYAASGRGTQIDLVVRGICCLRPEVAGQSDNIRVRSLVGRFLEHSRVFRFGSIERGFTYYIGSADLMPRNLDRRVETLVPVMDVALQARLQEILDASLRDDVLAWVLDADGRWTRVPTRDGINSQRWLQERALARARGEAPAADA